jgi:2-haloacid dehalogenase
MRRRVGEVSPESAAPSQTVDAVVLDVGGVLMDWDPRYLFGKLIDDADEREWFLSEVCSPQWNRRQDEGRRWADAVEEAARTHPEYEEWIRAYDARWLETVAGLFDDTVDILRELRQTSTPVYALTNFSSEKWAMSCEHFTELNEFDGIVVSGCERVAKPDPEIFHLLLERFDLTPGRTFFTDDVEDNVEAARVVGIDAERFTDPTTLRRHLAGRGVLTG